MSHMVYILIVYEMAKHDLSIRYGNRAKVSWCRYWTERDEMKFLIELSHYIHEFVSNVSNKWFTLQVLFL